jgi:hypothetical protein
MVTRVSSTIHTPVWASFLRIVPVLSSWIFPV